MSDTICHIYLASSALFALGGVLTIRNINNHKLVEGFMVWKNKNRGGRSLREPDQERALLYWKKHAWSLWVGLAVAVFGTVGIVCCDIFFIIHGGA